MRGHETALTTPVCARISTRAVQPCSLEGVSVSDGIDRVRSAIWDGPQP